MDVRERLSFLSLSTASEGIRLPDFDRGLQRMLKDLTVPTYLGSQRRMLATSYHRAALHVGLVGLGFTLFMLGCVSAHVGCRGGGIRGLALSGTVAFVYSINNNPLACISLALTFLADLP
jgi:hypothetical protein